MGVFQVTWEPRGELVAFIEDIIGNIRKGTVGRSCELRVCSADNRKKFLTDLAFLTSFVPLLKELPMMSASRLTRLNLIAGGVKQFELVASDVAALQVLLALQSKPNSQTQAGHDS